MASVRPPKKTQVVEVRVADELKAAFAERCRLDHVTVSEAVRRLMEERVAMRATAGASPRGRIRIVAAGLLGAALGIGVAAPSFAHEAAARPTFRQLDVDGNGVLTRAEYR